MVNVMLPQYIDIATRGDLRARKLPIVDHHSALYCTQIKLQFKLSSDIPSLVMDNAFETWINDPHEIYNPGNSLPTIMYRLGYIPLEDHLNRLMHLNSHKWEDQALVQIDEYWFKLGDWRWKYDTPRNKLLMCVDGPAEGNYTETLI